jgi:hypothetical protein
LVDSAGPLNPLARSQAASVIQSAAKATGADFEFLLHTARRESGLDPSAQAATSSARGLFQFTESTWLSMIERYGARHGVSAEGLSRASLLSMRDDPALSARMAGELANENAGQMADAIGRAPTGGELYAAHFLGPANAIRLVQAARSDSATLASQMFPAAAAANRSVFAPGGEDLSAGQLYAKLTGHGVAEADAGPIAPAPPAVAGATITPADAMIAARLGVAQLTSSLMSALFDLQSEPGRRDV